MVKKIILYFLLTLCILVGYGIINNHENTVKTKKTEKSLMEKEELDLSSKSSNMAYTDLYYMAEHPKEYIGKIVKIKGTYKSSFDKKLQRECHVCIVQDALKCCSLEMEFRLNNTLYPKDKEKITVKGTFQTYEENGETYCILDNAEIVEK